MRSYTCNRHAYSPFDNTSIPSGRISISKAAELQQTFRLPNDQHQSTELGKEPCPGDSIPGYVQKYLEVEEKGGNSKVIA
jgi:hypothetical protein